MTSVVLSEEGEDQPVSNKRQLVEELVAIVLFLAATLLTGTQIVLRSVFDIGLPWSEKGIVVMMIWSVYFGAGAVTARRRHVRMDLLATSSPALIGATIEVAASACTLIYVAIVTLLAWRFLAFVHASGGTDPSTELPEWWLVTGFPIGLTIMLARAGTDCHSRFRHMCRFL